MSLKPLVYFIIGGFCCAALQAKVPDGAAFHYQEIPERNVFGLMPPPAIKETPPQLQLPKIILTGITTILGNKRALMKTEPAGAKPGQSAKELSLILTEGQREGDIEVLQIDELAGSVKVNNSGTVMTLTLEKDGARLPAPPAPPPIPGGVPPVASIPAPLTNQLLYNPAFTNAPGVHPLPTRNFRPPATGTTAPLVPGQAAVGQSPVGGVPTPAGVVPVPGASQPTDLTPEEQAILQQVQREVSSPLTPAVSNVAAPGSQPPVPLLPQ